MNYQGHILFKCYNKYVFKTARKIHKANNLEVSMLDKQKQIIQDSTLKWVTKMHTCVVKSKILNTLDYSCMQLILLAF